MKKPNVLAVSIFIVAALSNLFHGSLLVASTSAALGAGFLLSGNVDVPSGNQFAVVPLLDWRRYSSVLLLIAVGLMSHQIGSFGYQVGRDARAKVERTESTRSW